MYKIRAVYLAKENYHFDQDYYVSGHLPLAKKQLEGKVRIKRIDVERNVKPLAAGDGLISPCTVSIYIQTEADLADFLRWLESPDAAPLNDDQANYTNCDIEWTIAEMEEFEGY